MPTDPLINNNKAWEGDEADEITIMLTIPDQSFQEASPST